MDYNLFIRGGDSSVSVKRNRIINYYPFGVQINVTVNHIFIKVPRCIECAFPVPAAKKITVFAHGARHDYFAAFGYGNFIVGRRISSVRIISDNTDIRYPLCVQY